VNRFVTGAALFAGVYASATAGVVASNSIALARAAAATGFVYSYLGPEDAASLSRPGVTVVIRPGQRLFDVNDRTEAMDGPAPFFSRNDLYVSESLVRRLRQIAAEFPAPAPEAGGMMQQMPPSTTSSSTAPANATGSIAKLTVSQVPGLQQLSVAGVAPANVPVLLTLVGSFSAEVPDVVLSRHRIVADRNGNFQSDLSIAPGYFRGAVLTVVASSFPGVASAKAKIVMKAPNGTTDIPADQDQKSIR
jgi:hypothetical protein